MSKSILTRLVLALAVCAGVVSSTRAATFTIGTNDFLLDGKPFLIKAGEMHPARIPHEYWADRLKDDACDGAQHGLDLRLLEPA